MVVLVSWAAKAPSSSTSLLINRRRRRLSQRGKVTAISAAGDPSLMRHTLLLVQLPFRCCCRHSLLLLLLCLLGAIICPSSGQLYPLSLPNPFDALPAADASAASLFDDQQPPVEVAPAELTVDGATDDEQSTTNALTNDAPSDAKTESIAESPSAATARTWAKRFHYSSVGGATHLASPTGTVPFVDAVSPFGGNTERRRKPQSTGATEEEQQQQQDQEKKTKEEHKQQRTGDEEGEVEADDESAVPNDASSAHLLAMEDVDRDEQTAVAAKDSSADDSLLTSFASPSSTSSTSSTASSSSTDGDGPPIPPPIVGPAYSPLSDSALLASTTTTVSAPYDTSSSPTKSDETTVPLAPSSSFSPTPAATVVAGGNSSSSLDPAPSMSRQIVAPTLSKDNKDKMLSRAGDGDDGDVPTTHAVGELDLKSDRELAKLMRRTTIRMRDYPTEVPTPSSTDTTPNPLVVAAQLAASQAPSLFPGALPGGGGPFALPPPSPLQSPHSATGAAVAPPSQSSRSAQQQARRHSPPRAEQFEQLGCGWDLMTQSCKDVFRVGWCESCADFGSPPFLHDCRCTAVTGLYVQTASFLGSSAAAARANAALTAANQTTANGGGTMPVAGVPPMLPLLPTLAQIGTPLEVPSNAGTTLPRTATTELQQQLLLANALRFPSPQPVPIVPMPTGAGFGLMPFGAGQPLPSAIQQKQNQQQQQQQQQPANRQHWDVITPILLASPAAVSPHHTDQSLNSQLFVPQLSATQFALMRKQRWKKRR